MRTITPPKNRGHLRTNSRYDGYLRFPFIQKIEVPPIESLPQRAKTKPLFVPKISINLSSLIFKMIVPCLNRVERVKAGGKNHDGVIFALLLFLYAPIPRDPTSLNRRITSPIFLNIHTLWREPKVLSVMVSCLRARARINIKHVRKSLLSKIWMRTDLILIQILLNTTINGALIKFERKLLGERTIKLAGLNKLFSTLEE